MWFKFILKYTPILSEKWNNTNENISVLFVTNKILKSDALSVRIFSVYFCPVLKYDTVVRFGSFTS